MKVSKKGVLCMSTKYLNVKHPYERMTHYDDSFVSKMRNVESLNLAPSIGSKNRLARYRKNLSVSQGTEAPLFDSAVVDLLRRYAWNSGQVENALDYLNHLTDPEGFLFSRNLKIYSTTQSAMERFSQPDHPSFRWNQNYVKSLESLKKDLSNFRLQPEKYDSDDDILKALPKVDTHSGYRFIESGQRKKGDNIEGLQAQLKDRKNRIRKGETVQKYPILIAFRTQASGEFTDEGEETGTCKHKTRVVSMYDLRDIVMELQFSNPIQRALNKTQFYAGGKSDREISFIIHGEAARFPKFMSIDYSSYDQTISSWLIEDAFDALKVMFPNMNAGQEKEFQFIKNNFIHKDFIVNEGVVHSDKGVPSGSMFTQIIDSIVNILVVRTYFNSIGRKCSMMAMGDDNVIFCPGEVNISVLASYIMKNFGLVVKVDEKSNEGDTRRDDVKFLSRFWRYDGPWRHPNQILSRIAFPERFRDYSSDIRPEHVLFSYYLAYPSGMRKLIDVNRFLRDYPISASYVKDKVDSRYVPGSLAYIREYTIR